MPWKEGVKMEEVQAYRELVKIARELDEKIDAGLTTPKEALKALDDARKKVA